MQAFGMGKKKNIWNKSIFWFIGEIQMYVQCSQSSKALLAMSRREICSLRARPLSTCSTQGDSTDGWVQNRTQQRFAHRQNSHTLLSVTQPSGPNCASPCCGAGSAHPGKARNSYEEQGIRLGTEQCKGAAAGALPATCSPVPPSNHFKVTAIKNHCLSSPHLREIT